MYDCAMTKKERKVSDYNTNDKEISFSGYFMLPKVKENVQLYKKDKSVYTSLWMN